MRELRGRLTQEEFAKQLGIKSQQAYQKYERGRVPKAPILQQIAQRCGVTVDWLLGNTNVRTAVVAEEVAAGLAAGPEGAAKKMTSPELLRTLAKYIELFNDPDLRRMKAVNLKAVTAIANELLTRPDEEWVDDPIDLPPKRSPVRYPG